MWPAGVRCAATFTFDLDAESVWIADNPANAQRPVALSQGRFGPRVALPWILALLARHHIQATFFVPGIVAERYPDAIHAIADAGHELAVHGYTHSPPTTLDRSEEEAALRRTHQLLGAMGPPPVGYRAPSWELSPYTLELLAKNGFSYSSNLMDDIVPYRHPGSRLIELPVHWTLDDAAHFAFDLEHWDKKMAAPSEVREIWEEEFEGFLDLGGAFILTLHPQIIGRPHRLKLLENFVQHVRSHEGVWIATCAELADRASSVLG